MDVPVARRIERPAWVNVRTVLGLLLFSLAFLAGQRLLAGARTTTGVWSVVNEVPRDAVLQAADLRLVDVKLPGTVMPQYVSADQDPVGMITTRTMRAGELVALAWVTDQPAPEPGRHFTIALASDQVLPALRAGDRVDVIATLGAGNPGAVTRPIVCGAEVVDLATAGGLVAADETVVGVTVAVSPREASQIAYVVRNADVDIVRVTGTAPCNPGDIVTSGDLR